MSIRPAIKQLSKNTAIYGTGNILSKLAAFFLIPIYTRYLSQTEVGIIALLEMLELFVVTIAPCGLINAVWRHIPGSTKEEKAKILSSAFWGINGMGFILSLILLYNRHFIAAHLNLGVEGASFVFIILCSSFLFVIGQFVQWMFQYEQKPFKYLLLTLFQFVGVLILNILFIVFLDKGVFGAVYSKLIISFFLFIIANSFIFRHAFVLPSFTVLKPMLKYGLPLVVTGLLMPVLTLSDRYFLNLFISLDKIGIYSIAYKFGMLINMLLVIPLQRTFTPMLYQSGMDEQSKDIYKDSLFYYAIIGSFFLLMIVYFSPLILYYFATEKYMSGVVIIPWIALAYYINGFRMFLRAGIILKDRTSLLGLIGLSAVLINLFLNYVLIMKYGINGAITSTVLSFLFVVILVYFTSQTISMINWSWSRLIKLFFILLMAIGLYLSIRNYSSDLTIYAIAISFIFYLLSIYFSKILGWREINGIKSILKKLGLLSKGIS